MKGQSFTHQLSTVTMLVGDNAVGKTAALTAIDLALAPKISPGNYPAIEKFFSGFLNMTVSVDTDEGSFARAFARKGESISQTFCSIRPEKGIPPVALDADYYFGLSIEKRAGFVASLVKLPETFSKGAIIAELKNKLTLPDGRNTEETQSTVCELLAAAEVNLPTATSVQEWLESTIELFVKRKQSCLAVKQRMEKSAQASVQIFDGTPGRSVASIEAQLKELAAVNQDLIEQLARIKIDYAIAKGKIEAEGMKGFVSKKTENEGLLREVSQEIAAANSEHHHGVAALTASLKELFPDLRPELQGKIDSADRQLRGVLQSFSTKTITESSLTKQLNDLTSLSHCPTCKAAGEGWREAVGIELETALKLVCHDLTDLNQQEQQALLLLDGAQAAFADHEKACNKNRRGHYESGIALLDETLNGKLSKLSTCRDSLQKLLSLDEALEQQYFTEQVSSKCSELDVLFALEIKSKDEQIAAERSKGDALQRDYKLAIYYGLQLKRKAVEQAERSKAVDDYDLNSIALDSLKLVLAKMVNGVFQRLLVSANRVADCVLKTPLHYRNGEVGRFDGLNRWVSSNVFSGTEQAALYASISYALAKDSGFKIVRVDELGRFSEKNKKKFINRIVELVAAGEIDQFIGVDVAASPYNQTAGVSVIELV